MVSTALTVSAQKRKIDLWGHVYDQVTHHAIRGAKATLMLADSTVVDSANCGYFTGGYYGTDANYCFAIPRQPQRYIIRVTHPDYEPCFVDYEVKTPGRNTYFDAPWHYMKRNNASAAHNAAAPHQPAAATDSLAAPHLLGEVVVKGTRIKMAYKNDTIVYNASAFQLPDGSMLDALVRQMPGVELKDDGTILVNGEKVDFLTLNGRASITLNKMGQRQGYNTTTGAFTQMLDNVSRPSWSLNQEAHFNRPLDTKKRLALDAHSRINYEEDNDFDVVQYSASDGQSAEALLKSAPRSTVRTLLNTEDLRLTYRIDRFDLAATGHFAYRHSTSNRDNFTTLNIYEYNYGFAINCRLPWKLQLAADAKMYSRRGYYSAAMNTDDLVCNASLSRSFLKEMLTVRLEAFDLFHQLRSTEYTLNAQGRVESWRKSIPSYLMLHVGWRWSHMPKKKSQRT